MLFYNKTTNNDQWIVKCIFPDERGKFFIEAGACDGIRQSSCYVLEKELAWQGICIEPNDSYFRDLVQNRPNSICENVCLSNKNSNVIDLEASGNAIYPMLNDIGSNIIQHRYNSQETVNKTKEIDKESKTLESLLKKHHAPKVIHYLAMDREGSAFPTLEVFPFEEYRILAISIEGKICNDLLLSKGYINVINPFNQNSFKQYFLHESIVKEKGSDLYVKLNGFLDGYIGANNQGQLAIKAQNQIEKAQAIFEQANQLKDSGYIQDAINNYKRSLKIKPNYIKSLLALSEIYESQENWTEAVKCYNLYISLQPDIPANSNCSVPTKL